MQIIKPSATIIAATPYLEQVIEQAGRTSYKSHDKITKGSSEEFIKARLNQHESVLEHGAITVKIVCDRGVSHELVRHRLASFTQESTRYCNYSKDKFGNEITVIEPYFWRRDTSEYIAWYYTCENAEKTYLWLLKQGAKPQEARSVLPNSLKTEIVVTANPREWRHIFSLRCSTVAHPQMREIMIPLANEFAKTWPFLFGEYEIR